MDQAVQEAEKAGGLPTLEVAGGWETFLEGAARQALERSAVPPFVRGQRWFGGKARRIEAVRFVDGAVLPTGAARAFLTLAELRFADGGTDLYFLPLAVTAGAGAAALLRNDRPRVLARLQGPGGEAVLHDALADPEVCTALFNAIGRGQELPTRQGRIRAYATAAYRELRGLEDVPLPPERGPETSSNSLVIYGRRLLLKLFRRLEVGINPDFEIGRFLTERTTFDRIPKVAGTIEYHRPGGEPVTLAILQALVPNQADGWHHALAELRHYFARAATAGAPPDLGQHSLLELADAEPPRDVLEAVGGYLGAAATLGRRTAEMHLELAGDPADPAFAPEPLTPADFASLTATARQQGRQAVDALRDHLGQLPEPVLPAAVQYLEEAPRVLGQLGGGPAAGPGAVKIRCHGDYHLGQVLWADNDYFLIDFEGEPTRTMAERRAKQSPLKDVAGMLRSYDYAAHAGLFAAAPGRPDEWARLWPWAELWRQAVSAAFLHAYRARAAGAPFLPADPAALAALLDLFMLDKAFYELVYELNNRPDWVPIPLGGILALMTR